MSDNNTDALKGWLIILAVIFILFLAAVLFIFLFSDFAFFNTKGLIKEQRIDYGARSLTTIGTIFGGIAVLINAYYAAKRAEAMDKSAQAANESAKAALENAEAALKNAQVAEDKQITERFAKAIEQLGNEKIEVRLGAIYTLERIAKDSLKDYWIIMEILTAFVRENAPLKPKEERVEEIQQQPKLRTDIQAALTVIGRRNCNDEKENQRLDLSYSDIRGAMLFEANLKKAIFKGANLAEAFLNKADLQEADFTEAIMQQAKLNMVNLQSAMLMRCNLQNANLSGAKLQEASLFRSNLQEAQLYQAELQNVNLSEAKLLCANLGEANLLEAFLDRSDLKGANFQGAKNLTSQQIERANGNRTTRLPDYVEAPTHWRQPSKDNSASI
ncbi:pentapeptide repeat-containing protein [Calothrix sp. NIES-2098]|uniref:pentapeptide repeat-containing protein n=1 Tax=Calothrix sp. NIES-2098 TaxID=1954171 RepID=UPI000B612FCD|nr:pentapeptide repeat-containing protein [Calothrix sp. NIES-2098]